MSFQRRTLLAVTVLLAMACVSTTTVMAVLMREAILEQTMQEGLLVANLLARTTRFADEVPREAEALVADQMIAEARLTAELVAAAEAAGRSPEDINRLLARIAEDTVLDEFWITDRKGHAYLHNAPGIDFTFSPDAAAQPQAHEFWALLTGARKAVVQPAQPRTYDGKVFKYVGVGGADHPRIVQVGLEAPFFAALKDRVGVAGLVRDLVAGGEFSAVRVVDKNFVTLAYSAVPGVPPLQPGEPLDTEKLRGVLENRTAASYFDAGILKAVYPIIDDSGEVIGATQVYLPTQRCRGLIREAITWAAGISILVLVLAVLDGRLVADRLLAHPIRQLTLAADQIGGGDYDTEEIADLTGRRDELGHLARRFRQMAEEVQRREKSLWEAKLDTIRRLVLAAEHKDQDTAAHIQRMSLYAELIARRLGLPPRECELLRLAAPMHDVGKIGIPDAILMKPGQLTDDEWDVMRTHTLIGASILSGSASELLQAGEIIALSHHEQWNGNGYPHGLVGEEIPLWGRICAVADVFDALTSVRPYKPAYSIEEAVRMLLEGRGTHFQPELVDLFVGSLDEVTAIQRRYSDPDLQRR